MDAMQALRTMIEASGLTHRQVARRLGRYDAYVSQVLTRTTNPATDTLASIARACGYRLELVPIDEGAASIAIGDALPDEHHEPGDEIMQARALLARACALLENVARDGD